MGSLLFVLLTLDLAFGAAASHICLGAALARVSDERRSDLVAVLFVAIPLLVSEIRRRTRDAFPVAVALSVTASVGSIGAVAGQWHISWGAAYAVCVSVAPFTRALDAVAKCSPNGHLLSHAASLIPAMAAAAPASWMPVVAFAVGDGGLATARAALVCAGCSMLAHAALVVTTRRAAARAAAPTADEYVVADGDDYGCCCRSDDGDGERTEEDADEERYTVEAGWRVHVAYASAAVATVALAGACGPGSVVQRMVATATLAALATMSAALVHAVRAGWYPRSLRATVCTLFALGLWSLLVRVFAFEHGCLLVSALSALLVPVFFPVTVAFLAVAPLVVPSLFSLPTTGTLRVWVSAWHTGSAAAISLDALGRAVSIEPLTLVALAGLAVGLVPRSPPTLRRALADVLPLSNIPAVERD